MLKNTFGSINKSIVLIIIVAILLSVATFFERTFGSAMALALFYHSWWLWGLLTLGVMTVVYQVFIMRRFSIRRVHSILIHGSFVFIVCGAMITHFFSQEAFLMLRKGEQTNLMLDERQLPIGELPFVVGLEDFRVERYGGSGMPSNYVSDIVILDGGDSLSFTISMNKIVRYGNYKLYQSSYDGDELGSVLMVNDDYWGTIITYIGYVLLMLGMVLIVFNRRSRFRELLRKSTVILVFCAMSLTAEAQVTKQNIKDISLIPVQAASGRVEPFSTFAGNIVQKLYKDKSYNGVKSEVIVFEILSGNPRWQNEPIIKLASENLQRYLGAQSLYVSYNDFISADGDYILAEIMNEIYHKKQDRLSRMDKDLLKLDERLNVIYHIYNQKLPLIIPIPDSDQKWLSLADARSMEGTMLGVELDSIIAAFNYGRGADAFSRMVTDFSEQQREDTIMKNRVSRYRLICERWYNNLNLVFLSAILIILMSVIGIITFLIGVAERKQIVVAFERLVRAGLLLGIIALTFNVLLRWYVAGRVPMSNSYETLLCVALTLLVGGWFFRRISILVVSAISFVAGCFLMISYVGGLDPQITPLVPILNSHWLLFHVATIAVSYGLFALSAVMGVMYMVLMVAAPDNNIIKAMTIKMTALNELAQIAGVAFLTIGIFLGAIWANVSWGRYWGWDPKETWALITMFAYVANIHLFMSKRFYSRFLINLLSIFGIGFVVMTFFGVNHFFGGMHSYGGDYSFPFIGVISVLIILVIIVTTAKLRDNSTKHEKLERHEK